MQTLKKAWGYEEVLVNEEYCAKYLCINPGFQCSLHYHKIKKETFIVERGEIILETGKLFLSGRILSTEILQPGDTRTIPPNTLHRFSSEFGGRILEVSTHHEDEDVTRLEPSGPMRHVRGESVRANDSSSAVGQLG